MLDRITRDEQNAVAGMMERYGGHFVRRLGKALSYADPDNASRIKAAFPEYWQKYVNIKEGSSDGQIYHTLREVG